MTEINSVKFSGQHTDYNEVKQSTNNPNIFYISNSAGGIQIIDLEDMINPLLISALAIDGDTDSIVLIKQEQYAITASGIKGIYLIDLSNI